MKTQKTQIKKRKAKVLIVDDHPVVRSGLIQLINRDKTLEVCGEAGDSEEALEAIEAMSPDVAVIDISLSGKSGLDLIKIVQRRYSKLPILVLSIHDEDVFAERALRAGAKGYVEKREASDRVVSAIQKVLEGRIVVSERIMVRLVDQFVVGKPVNASSSPGQLSNRELEVFELIGSGLGTRQIAEKLALSVKTIEAHRANIKKKLKLKNAAELLQRAIHWLYSDRVGNIG